MQAHYYNADSVSKRLESMRIYPIEKISKCYFIIATKICNSRNGYVSFSGFYSSDIYIRIDIHVVLGKTMLMA